MKKSVVIGSNRYAIHEVDKIKGPHKKGMLIYGQFNPSKSKILLRKHLHNNKIPTLIHEICHGIEYEYNIDLTERQVDVFARELCCALRQLDILN